MSPAQTEVVRERIPVAIDRYSHCWYCGGPIAKWERGALLVIETTEWNPHTGNFRAADAHAHCR